MTARLVGTTDFTYAVITQQVEGGSKARANELDQAVAPW